MDHQEIINKISKGAVATGEFLAEKAVLAKDFAVLSGEITRIQCRISTLYRSAGKALYRAHATEADTAGEIEGYMAELAFLHRELKEKQAARQALRSAD